MSKKKTEKQTIETVKMQDNTMNKRVFGLMGVNVDRGNWNADFSGYPKSIDEETIYGSDKALKYVIRDNAYNNGYKVLYKKKLTLTKEGKIVPMVLDQKIIYEFEDVSLGEKDSSIEVATSLFKCWDVKQFGCAFAVKGHNISVAGAVQITNGYNIYKDAIVMEEDILSPFKNSKGSEDGQMTSIGKRVFVDKAIYVYPLVINPRAYKEFIDLGFTEGYTEEDYNSFKEISLNAVDNVISNTKVGCTNNFAIFIETTPNTFIPQLDKYLEYSNVDGEDVFTLKIEGLLKKLGDKVLNIEVNTVDGVKVIVEGWE